MLSNELSSLQDVVSILNNYNDYTTYIEVSPTLYNYLKLKIQEIYDLDIEYKNPETLYGCRIFINPKLQNYDYNIIRKENKDAK